MKKYFLGPNAANFLSAQMRNQGAATGKPGDNLDRLSGMMMPFEITGDWEKRNDESVYSCLAKQIFFDGLTYTKDVDGFEFILYSPKHLEEKPDYSVGEIVNAVLRGVNWEIIGGGGGGGAPSYARYGVTQQTFSAGAIGNINVYLSIGTATPGKALLAPNYAQVAIAPNTPCIVMPTDYTNGGVKADWLILNALYSSGETV